MGSGLPFWLCQAVFVALVIKNVALALFKVFEKCIVENSLLIYVLLSSYLSFDKVRIPRTNLLSRFVDIDKEGNFSLNGDPRMVY